MNMLMGFFNKKALSVPSISMARWLTPSTRPDLSSEIRPVADAATIREQSANFFLSVSRSLVRAWLNFSQFPVVIGQLREPQPELFGGKGGGWMVVSAHVLTGKSFAGFFGWP